MSADLIACLPSSTACGLPLAVPTGEVLDELRFSFTRLECPA